MRNILTVPEELMGSVVLRHYEGLDFSLIGNGGKEGDEEASRESVKLQRQKLREMLKLQVLLEQEKRENEATLRSIQALLGQTPLATASSKLSETKVEPDIEDADKDKDIFSFLQNKRTLKSDRTGANLTTSTDFALSNLPALKNILEDVQPRLDKLKKAGSGAGEGDARSEWRKERNAFVEKETRRHLEDVRGLELGEQGEVRDGEWQGQGRRVGMDEVEGLERVVGLFDHGEKTGKGKPKDADRMDES